MRISFVFLSCGSPSTRNGNRTHRPLTFSGRRSLRIEFLLEGEFECGFGSVYAYDCYPIIVRCQRSLERDATPRELEIAFSPSSRWYFLGEVSDLVVVLGLE
eukprot:GHVT01088407.1.p1 GENE.GHVT01088407.1~~GHVT01088407.1.p1  ORF type:complete len:102 (-),score=0.08 GHVT01088407.1:122-427(-)